MAQSALAIAGEKCCAVGANRQNLVIAAAIAHASIPALVGLDPLVHSHIVSEQIERKHGETMPRLRTSRRLLASSIV